VKNSFLKDSAKTKIYKSDGRHFLYLPKDLITDSQFPLRPGERLTVTFTKTSLIIPCELEEEDIVYIRIPRDLYWKFNRILNEAGAHSRIQRTTSYITSERR